MDRRRFLRLAGAGAAVTLVGCGGSDSSSNGNSGGDGNGNSGGDGNGNDPAGDNGDGMTDGSGMTDDGMTDGVGTAMAANDLTIPQNDVPDVGHGSAADLASQPVLGEWTGKIIIAYEDPSCSRCRAFHEQVYPKIKSNLIETRKVAYVYRSYPVVYPWGKPASRAVEATFARDQAAGWDLLDHYFGSQSSFDTGNVLDRTEQFLSANTAVDGSAVVTAVENDEAEPAVKSDLDAGNSAGYSVTPTLSVFRNNEHATEFEGSLSYDALATILGE